jgi:hypothetical protein
VAIRYAHFPDANCTDKFAPGPQQLPLRGEGDFLCLIAGCCPRVLLYNNTQKLRVYSEMIDAGRDVLREEALLELDT